MRLKLCRTAAPRLLIFSSLNGTSRVHLKLCCTAAHRLLILSSLDGTSSVRLKLCCTAAHRLLILSSLDSTSSVRLKLCCTALPRLLTYSPPYALGIFSSVDGSSCVRLKLCCRYRPVTSRMHWVQLRHQLYQQLQHRPIAPSWRFALHPMYLLIGYRSSPSLLPCLVDFIANDFAPSGILAWLRT